MLTRHFYKEDEVNSALLWSCATGRVREGLFWTQELIDSNCALDALRILVHAWILFVGVRRLSWLEQACKLWSAETFEEEELILLAYQLLMIPVEHHDVTCLGLLYLGTQDLEKTPERLLAKGWSDTTDTSIQAMIHRSIAQGKCEYLWYFLRSEWNTDTLKMLSDACSQTEKKKGLEWIQTIQVILNDDTKIWFLRAIAVSVACCPEKILRESFQPVPTQVREGFRNDLNQWEKDIGRKDRRQYSIPRDCLYWVTERGNLTYYDSTVEEIPDLLLHLSGNSYWDEALGGLPFDDLTEEDKVNFLELYFPDGHPMTWSSKELEKSHGSGALRIQEIPSHTKWLRSWIRNKQSCLIWKGWERAFQVASALEDLELNSYYETHQTIWKEHRDSWKLSPVKKQLVIKSVEQVQELQFEPNLQLVEDQEEFEELEED